jgi:hypothetical protein
MFLEQVFFNTLLLDQHCIYFILVVLLFMEKKNYSFLQNQQVGETVRELGLAGQNEKERLLWEV